MKTRRDRPLHFRGKQAPSKTPVSSGPSPVDLLLQEALAHHQAGRLPEAEALYRQILQASPDHPDALHLLGVIAYQVGQFSIGLELIDQAIRAKPDFAEAYNSRGSCLHALERYQEAVETYDKAILLNRTMPTPTATGATLSMYFSSTRQPWRVATRLSF